MKMRAIAILAVLMIASIGAFPASATATGGPKKVDVIFVLDNSGSMRQNDPEFLTRAAVRDFATALADDDSMDGRIAIVLFDGESRLVQGLTETKAGEIDALLDPPLSELSFSGQRTNTPAGIERALYEFRQNGRKGAAKAIVLLTDGQIDTGDHQQDLEAARWLREDLADESEASGIHIFGVAFTESADYQLMQALAQRTHAAYYRAFEAFELAQVVDNVLRKVVEDDFYSLALADGHASQLQPESVSLATAKGASAESTPPTTAIATADRTPLGLLALLPAVALLVGGSLLWRRRTTESKADAPPAQILDIGGHLGETGAVIKLTGASTRIGRDPHNDIVIDDDTISSEHAILEFSSGRYWLEDRRSTNGTRVGDTRLDSGQRVELKGGDHIRLADIDLMFVLAGYVPGGATVFLSSPTGPPSAWNVDLKPADSDSSEPYSSVKVVDLDDRLLDSEHKPQASATIAEKPPEVSLSHGPLSLLPMHMPKDSSGKASESNESKDSNRSSASSSHVSIEVSIEKAVAAKKPVSASHSSISVEASDFRKSLDYHLSQISEISPAFADFIESTFDDELRNALSVSVRELASDANKANRIQQKQYTFNRVRFAICGVPGSMDRACDHFVSSFGGFTRMLTEQLHSESFRKDRCEILAVLSAGSDDSPWVSLSIVPDQNQNPRIDLLSYEFLTDAERQEIESSENVEVSRSGFA